MTAPIDMGPHGVDCAGCGAVAGVYCTRKGKPRRGYCRERWDAVAPKPALDPMDFRQAARSWRGRISPYAKVDPRRDSMMWLMRQTGLYTFRTIAEAFGVSIDRCRQIIMRREGEVAGAAKREQLKPSCAATQRLAAAGALPPVDHHESAYYWPLPHQEQRELERQAERAAKRHKRIRLSTTRRAADLEAIEANPDRPAPVRLP